MFDGTPQTADADRMPEDAEVVVCLAGDRFDGRIGTVLARISPRLRRVNINKHGPYMYCIAALRQPAA